ncbi:MAG TPA: methyltransferase domain-containing protein [Candidatus Solibacter sp.]|nr:methyltransferase domain-containing protein [Candidatus Solibacter sp.]
MAIPRLILSALIAIAAAAQTTPEKLLEAINVRAGGTVCEIGAGDGSMSINVARIVGPNGRVYTNELGEDHVKKLRDKIAAAGLAQITVVGGETTRTNFPEGGCDGVFLRDVYHHFTDPAAMNASIAASLKPGGRLAVVDFKPPPDKEALRPEDRGKDGSHGVTPETVSRELKTAGFEPVTSEQPAGRWFMVVVSRPTQ